MDDRAETVIAAIIGFLIGGIVADAVERVANLLVAAGGVGVLLGGLVGALRRLDATRSAALGGGFGLALGLVVLVIDAIAGG